MIKETKKFLERMLKEVDDAKAKLASTIVPERMRKALELWMKFWDEMPKGQLGVT